MNFKICAIPLQEAVASGTQRFTAGSKTEVPGHFLTIDKSNASLVTKKGKINGLQKAHLIFTCR